ncbi:hypothetical protein ACFQ4K_02385 [Tistrella bauzanensis]
MTLSDVLALEATGTAARTSADFDPSSNPEAPGTNDALSYSGRLTAIATLADGRVENRTTLSGARLDRESNNPCRVFRPAPNSMACARVSRPRPISWSTITTTS